MRLRLGEAICTNVTRRRYSGHRSKKRSQRPEALGQALGVVDALDAHAQELGVDARARPQELGAASARRLATASGATLIGNGRTWVVCWPRTTVKCSQSMRPSIVRSTVSRKLLQWNWVWKPIEVGAEHAEQDLVLPGADAERLEVRPRDVPEERDPRVGARAA